MSSNNEDIVILKKADSTLTQVMQAVANLEKAEPVRRLSIGLSSSVTIELLGLYLRKHGLLTGTQITIHQGNYDDPIGDVDLFLSAAVENIVILPFFDTLMPSFEAQLACLEPELLATKEIEVRNRYRIAFKKAKSFNTIFLGSFHRLDHTVDISDADTVASVLARFNYALREEAAAFPNIRILDTENVVRRVGHMGQSLLITSGGSTASDRRICGARRPMVTRAPMDAPQVTTERSVKALAMTWE